MNNENQNLGTELNEAALSGVSGGLSEEQLAKAMEIAKRTCAECRRDALQHCKSGGPELLAYSLDSHDIECGYYSYTKCRFIRGSVG